MWNALSFANVREVIFIVAGVLVIAGSLYAYRRWKLSRVTPEERERQRRTGLVARGKMGDATVTEFRGDLLFYSYSVRGVEYIASQDLTHLHEYLPADPLVLVGSVSVRYDPKNPANSIVLAEQWSGLRVPSDQEEVKGSRATSKVKSK